MRTGTLQVGPPSCDGFSKLFISSGGRFLSSFLRIPPEHSSCSFPIASALPSAPATPPKSAQFMNINRVLCCQPNCLKHGRAVCCAPQARPAPPFVSFSSFPRAVPFSLGGPHGPHCRAWLRRACPATYSWSTIHLRACPPQVAPIDPVGLAEGLDFIEAARREETKVSERRRAPRRPPCFSPL